MTDGIKINELPEAVGVVDSGLLHISVAGEDQSVTKAILLEDTATAIGVVEDRVTTLENQPIVLPIGDLSDVDTTTAPAAFGQTLVWNTFNWVPLDFPDPVDITGKLDNDLTQSHSFATKVAMEASTIIFEDGKRLEWRGYDNESDGGSGWGIVSSGAHTADFGSVFSLAGGKYISVNLKGKRTNITKYGAIGTGADVTARIQQCFTNHINVYIPEPDSYYLVTDTITCRGGQNVESYSKLGGGVINDPLKSIYGNMVTNGTPLFKLGDAINGSLRKMTFSNLRAYCLNGPVIYSRLSTENTFTGCSFASRFYHCIDTQQSYIWSFYNCTIGSSGTVNDLGVDPTYCWLGLDNSNGFTFDTCRMSGGSSGGVADIGRSYTIAFRSCVVESSKYGIHIGKNPSVTLSGECNSITLDTCQFESCLNTIDAGSVWGVNGLTINNYLTTNPATDVILDACVVLGRVRDLVIDGAQFDTADNAYPFMFKYDAVAAGGGSLAHLTNSTIKNVFYKRVTAGFDFVPSGFPNPDTYNRLAENDMQLLGTDTGKLKQYTTPPILCSAGTVPAYFKLHEIKPLGSILLKVEILMGTGALDGQLVMGWSGAQAEYFSVANIGSFTLTDGYADISSAILTQYMRATQDVRIRLSGGSTASTFQLRITYKQ